MRPKTFVFKCGDLCWSITVHNTLTQISEGEIHGKKITHPDVEHATSRKAFQFTQKLIREKKKEGFVEENNERRDVNTGRRRGKRSDDFDKDTTSSYQGQRSKKKPVTSDQHEGDLRKHLQKKRHKKAVRDAESIDPNDTDTDMATDDTDSIASTASVASKTETKTTTTGMSPLNRRRLQLRPGETKMDAAAAPHPALLARVSTTYFLRSQMALTTLDRSDTVEMSSPTKAAPLERMETTGRWEKWRGEDTKQGPVKAGRSSRNQTKPYSNKTDENSKNQDQYAKLLASTRNDTPRQQPRLKRNASSRKSVTPEVTAAGTSMAQPKLSDKKSTTADLRLAILNQNLNEAAGSATNNHGSSKSTMAGTRLKRKATMLLSPILEGAEREGQKALTKGRGRKVRIVTPAEGDAQKGPSSKRATECIDDIQSPSVSGDHQAKRLCVLSSTRECPSHSNHGNREVPLYVPPREEWPVTMSGLMTWNMPLLTEDGQPLPAQGLFVGEGRCLVAIGNGSVLCLDTSEWPMQPGVTYKLPSKVQSLVADGEFLYAGCCDTSLYDLSHNEPRLVLKVELLGQVESYDVHKGQVAISDQHSSVGMVSHSGEFIWCEQSKGRGGVKLKIDDTGLYNCHSNGMSKYSLEGTHLWTTRNSGGHYQCKLVGDYLYAAPYTYTGVRKLDKHTGAVLYSYGTGKSDLKWCHSLEVTDKLVIVGGDIILCYDIESGEIVYKINLSTACTKVTTKHIQYHEGRLLCLADGMLTVLTLTEQAVKNTQQGLVMEPVELPKVPAVHSVPPLKRVATVTKSSQSEGGILIECSKPKARKGKLLVRAISTVQNKTWAVQLSPDLQRPGARYIVDDLKSCPAGNYYRVCGDIKEVE